MLKYVQLDGYDYNTMTINAILWDFDGTLVDSTSRNLHITKQILSIVAPHLSGSDLPLPLHSKEHYKNADHQARNWQDLYTTFYGLTYQEMQQAGKLWSVFQEKSPLEFALFEGIKDVLQQHAAIPHGICSQNAQKNICNLLEKNHILNYFQEIIGYDDIPSHYQKPHYWGGVKCLERMQRESQIQRIVYIGDHESDTLFARNLQSQLGYRVNSIAVAYSGANPLNWENAPDYIAYSVSELSLILRSLT
ncbi:HAD family hydrolase [Providencia rettgeri]|uniref:HAD family hydrolase n=1 Tax=Providencia rettgeri TaxID=587 RepID=UPI0023AAFCDF|nr:HAD-IA family hydrolase [Providencia rettgeri]